LIWGFGAILIGQEFWSLFLVNEIVTTVFGIAIEILSPVNKRSSLGTEKYELKRELMFSSRTHLLHINI